MYTLTNTKDNTTKIYARTIEDGCMEQLQQLVENLAYCDSKVRIMPDCHAGLGSVIGFTATFDDKIIPNTVGVDISCGMEVVNLGKVDIDLPHFDDMVKLKIPSGLMVRDGKACDFKALEDLHCYRELEDTKRIIRSIGTLGGGNHFIELDRNGAGETILVIHTGSRNLGKQVCEYYQNIAVDLAHGKEDYYREREALIARYKREGRRSEIQMALKGLKYERKETDLPDDQCFLYGEWAERYLHDMRICQQFAHLNRETIAEILVSKYFKGRHLDDCEHFETLHNYIDLKHNIIRKGAVSAMEGERLIIPMNMRDGSLICIGKGNDDWNCSAPHGAGRIMSRSKAFGQVSLEDFRKSMEGIYTTTANEQTIDEAPMAYKPMDEIVDLVSDTVEIVDVIKPIYNFKAADDVRFWRNQK